MASPRAWGPENPQRGPQAVPDFGPCLLRGFTSHYTPTPGSKSNCQPHGLLSFSPSFLLFEQNAPLDSSISLNWHSSIAWPVAIHLPDSGLGASLGGLPSTLSRLGSKTAGSIHWHNIPSPSISVIACLPHDPEAPREQVLCLSHSYTPVPKPAARNVDSVTVS